MNAPSLEQIVEAVLRWQHRHPLAQRLQASQVQGIGLVALPFVRSDEPPPPQGWRRWLQRLPQPLRPAPAPPATFSEAFIDGLSPIRAAHFAHRHGAESVEAAEDWPQRRIEVDGERAALAGGWPYEVWLVTAALDDARGRRHRVLVGLQASPQGVLPVLGSRHADPRRWGAALAALGAVGVALFLALQDGGAPPPAVRVSGSVAGASAPSGSASGLSQAASAGSTLGASAALPSSAASTVAAPASDAALVSSGALAGPAPGVAASGVSPGAREPSQALSQMSEAPFDIRPQLRRSRDETTPRPPLLRSAPAAAQSPEAPTAAKMPEVPPPPAGTSPAARAESPAPAAQGGYQGARQPEQVRPRWAAPGQTTLALVSPPFSRKDEAEAMLARMREHLQSALQTGETLDGGVFESPQGHRAAVWPFGSREEAQIVNATMVARGWRTRAVEF